MNAPDGHSADNVVTLGGDFWIAANPAVRARGVFTAEAGDRPWAALEQKLVTDPRVSESRRGTDRVISFSANPARSVASFLPTTLHGQLDTAEPVTILDAQNLGTAGSFQPRYRGTAAVIGANVLKDQLYSAVRFRLDRPHWTGHLADGESCVIEDDGSTLSVEGSEDGNWLVYESAAPAPLRRLEIRVVTGCLALLQLAIYPDHERVTRETQVRISSEGPWLKLRGPAFYVEPGGPEHETLLTREHLTVAVLANWIEIHTRLDGLTWAIARPFRGVVQMQVQILTSLIEGFHRELPGFVQEKYPGVSRAVLRQVLEAAREAAVAQASAEGLDEEQVRNSISFPADVSFRQRAEAVVAEVCSVVPEVTESITRLAWRIRNARTDLAHQLSNAAEKSIEIRAQEWRVVADVASWLLRCLLLLRAGIEPQVLHERLLMFQRFGFFRANTAQHARDLGWDLPAPS
jgi:hypothetical protein